MIATRAIALISLYVRRIIRSRNQSRVLSRVRFYSTFIHARLLADAVFVRQNTHIHIHTRYTYMCIYDFSMCTSSLPAPLCRSRSSNFRDSAIRILRASIRSIDVIATLFPCYNRQSLSFATGFFVLANSNRFEVSLEGLPTFDRIQVLIRRIWRTINSKSVNQGQDKCAPHEIAKRIWLNEPCTYMHIQHI